MSVDKFCRLLHGTKLGKNDKKWFPKWLRRYAATVPSVDGNLLASNTPAWQRLQAIRAVEAYRNLVLRSQRPSLEPIRRKLSRLAARGREDRPGVRDERHLVGVIDPNEPEIVQRMRKELRLHHKALWTERS